MSRALALISDGALDAEGTGVETLADRLGVGSRQLRRLFMQHVGASPVAVAQTRRVLFAKQLIHETQMSMAEIALVAGFGSVRRFNEVFRDLFQRPPSTLRRRNLRHQPGVTLRLRYRPPYDWESMLRYLERRSLEGMERVENRTYCRSFELDGVVGTVHVAHVHEAACLSVTIHTDKLDCLPRVVTRIRRVFDLGADIETITSHLSCDPLLAPLIAQRPGLRAPGGWDGFELAVRAILGQQVSLAAARQLGSRLIAFGGRRASGALRGDHGISRIFPTPEWLATADLSGLGMPDARRRALRAVAEAALANPRLFGPFGTIEEAIARLRSIRGVGEWTAQYIALRALREMDAFPASDVGLLRGAALISGCRPTPASLLQRAEPWRPWRAYAAQHLWAAGSAVDPPNRSA